MLQVKIVTHLLFVENIFCEYSLADASNEYP